MWDFFLWRGPGGLQRLAYTLSNVQADVNAYDHTCTDRYCVANPHTNRSDHAYTGASKQDRSSAAGYRLSAPNPA